MTHTPNTLRHVAKAVAAHDFTDARDWAHGLAELAALSDAEIEATAAAVPARCAVPSWCRETGAVYYCNRSLATCFFARRLDEVAANALGEMSDFAALPRSR